MIKFINFKTLLFTILTLFSIFGVAEDTPVLYQNIDLEAAITAIDDDFQNRYDENSEHRDQMSIQDANLFFKDRMNIYLNVYFDNNTYEWLPNEGINIEDIDAINEYSLNFTRNMYATILAIKHNEMIKNGVSTDDGFSYLEENMKIDFANISYNENEEKLKLIFNDSSLDITKDIAESILINITEASFKDITNTILEENYPLINAGRQTFGTITTIITVGNIARDIANDITTQGRLKNTTEDKLTDIAVGLSTDVISKPIAIAIARGACRLTVVCAIADASVQTIIKPIIVDTIENHITYKFYTFEEMLAKADIFIVDATEAVVAANFEDPNEDNITEEAINEMQIVYLAISPEVNKMPAINDYIDGVVSVSKSAELKLGELASKRALILKEKINFDNSNLSEFGKELAMGMYRDDMSVILTSMSRITNSLVNNVPFQNTKLETDITIAKKDFYEHVVAAILENFEDDYLKKLKGTVSLNLQLVNQKILFQIPSGLWGSYLMNQHFDDIDENFTFNLRAVFQDYINNTNENGMMIKTESIVKVKQVEEFETLIGTTNRKQFYMNQALTVNTTGSATNDTIYIDKIGGIINASEGDDLIISNVDIGHKAVITGGKGNDIIFGGNGPDQYVFNRGDGNDIIYENSGFSEHDKFIWGSTISIADRIVTNEGSDQIITINNGGGSIRVIDGMKGSNNGVETEECNDCTETSLDDALSEFDNYIFEDTTINGSNVNKTYHVVDGVTLTVINGNFYTNIRNIGSGNIILKGNFEGSKITSSGKIIINEASFSQSNRSGYPYPIITSDDVVIESLIDSSPKLQIIGNLTILSNITTSLITSSIDVSGNLHVPEGVSVFVKNIYVYGIIYNNGNVYATTQLTIDSPMNIQGSGTTTYGKVSFNEAQPVISSDLIITNGKGLNVTFNIENGAILTVINGDRHTNIRNIGDGDIILKGNFESSRVTSNSTIILDETSFSQANNFGSIYATITSDDVIVESLIDSSSKLEIIGNLTILSNITTSLITSSINVSGNLNIPNGVSVFVKYTYVDGNIYNNGSMYSATLTIDNPLNIKGSGITTYNKLMLNESQPIIDSDFIITNGKGLNKTFNVENGVTLTIINGDRNTNIRNIGDGDIILKGDFKGSKITSNSTIVLDEVSFNYESQYPIITSDDVQLHSLVDSSPRLEIIGNLTILSNITTSIITNLIDVSGNLHISSGISVFVKSIYVDGIIYNNGSVFATTQLTIDTPLNIQGSGVTTYTKVSFNDSQPIIDSDFIIINGNGLNKIFNIYNGITLTINNGNSSTRITNSGEGNIKLTGTFSSSKITTSGSVDYSGATGTIILNGTTVDIDAANLPTP